MSGFVRVCAVSELEEESAARFVVGGTPVCVARGGDGQFYALHDVCSHAEVALSEGDVEGHTIECWLHGSRFDLRTGRPTGLPATKPVRVYHTKVEGDDVLVAV